MHRASLRANLPPAQHYDDDGCCICLPSHCHHSNANISFQAAKVARASARAVPSVIARFFVTTFRVLRSPPFVVSLVVVVSSVFQLVSLTRTLTLTLARDSKTNNAHQ